MSLPPPHPTDPSCPRPSPHRHGHSERRSIAAAELIQSFQELQGRRLIVLHRLVCACVCVCVPVVTFCCFCSQKSPTGQQGEFVGFFSDE